VAEKEVDKRSTTLKEKRVWGRGAEKNVKQVR